MDWLLEEKDLSSMIQDISPLLHEGFVLWLQGDMGAGKTSFVRAFLRFRGLAESTSVISPTYTILNEYLLGEHWYAHLDLYRAESSFSLDEIGVRDRAYAGIFLEWPEAPGLDETISPTHVLEIDYAEDGLKRSYHFESIK